MLDTHARKYVQPTIDRVAKLLLKAGITANQVTVTAFVVGISAGCLIYIHWAWLAVAVLWLSGFLDAVDGSMAREQQNPTSWGTLMDVTFDRIVELSVIIALAATCPQAQFLLLLLTSAIVFSMTVFLTVAALSEKKGVKSFYYQAGLAERTEGFIMFTLMILLPGLLLWTTGLFFLVEVFTGLQRMYEAKRIL